MAVSQLGARATEDGTSFCARLSLRTKCTIDALFPLFLLPSPNSSLRNTITVTDNRTGKSVEIEVGEGNTVPAPRLGQLGIRLYDPAYMNTAVARSKICEVDGDNGILRYAGYPIEQLAEKSDHIEVAYLLAFGELPTKEALAEWRRGIMNNSAVPDGVLNVIKSFRPVSFARRGSSTRNPNSED